MIFYVLQLKEEVMHSKCELLQKLIKTNKSNCTTILELPRKYYSEILYIIDPTNLLYQNKFFCYIAPFDIYSAMLLSTLKNYALWTFFKRLFLGPSQPTMKTFFKVRCEGSTSTFLVSRHFEKTIISHKSWNWISYLLIRWWFVINNESNFLSLRTGMGWEWGLIKYKGQF